MIVQSDDACQAYLAGLLAWIAAGVSFDLHLYSNDALLSPANMDPLQFVETTYGDYAWIATKGAWGSPIRDSAGLWHLASGPWTFQRNTGTSPGLAYGWYIQRGPRVVFAERFPGPATILPGLLGPTLIIRLSQASQSVICPGS